MRWCAPGSHQVLTEECQAEDGRIRAACGACLARLRERTAAAALAQEQIAAMRNDYEDAAGDGDADGIEGVAIDEFDAEFGDGNDLMDVDLPDDSAVSARERALLKILDEKLADIKFETCDYCLEEGFSMQVNNGMCASCKRDNGDPVRKWSAENGIHPGIYHFSAFNVNLLTECLISALNIPPCLKGLTDMEEMLIARVKVCMQVR
jgi:hypothetical protein